MSNVRPATALLSVFDKTGITELASALMDVGCHILSTGGTAQTLEKAGVHVQEVADYTQYPELFEGRVKTLHPRIVGGILARPSVDQEDMNTYAIKGIELVVINLYPFSETIANPETTFEQAIENIDVGGVTAIRAAAKNHESVAVVVDPSDYAEVVERLSNDNLDQDYRTHLAAKAFRHTANYDAAIAKYLSHEDDFPELMTLSYKYSESLRYGENPHQVAAFYVADEPHPGPMAALRQHQGRQLSFNNIADADAAIACSSSFSDPACVIVKHANPCGVAIAKTIDEAYACAFRTDPVSAFGGIIAFNRTLNVKTMAAIVDNQFAEVVVAPAIEDGVEGVASRRKKLRLLTLESAKFKRDWQDIRKVQGGLLVQRADTPSLIAPTPNVVTQRYPTPKELEDLRFAWHVVHFVKSNAIVFARDGYTTGIGAGQMNRVLSVKIASMRANEERLNRESSVLASDAFFPFRDGLDEAAKAGITAVIQPGGSVRDAEVIEAADEHNITMVFTDQRHFRH